LLFIRGCRNAPFFITAIALLLLASPAAGQGNVCFDRPAVIERLAQKFKEYPAWVGLTNRGHMLELYASQNGETWTLLVSSGNGLTCLVATGEGSRMIDEPKPEDTAS